MRAAEHPAGVSTRVGAQPPQRSGSHSRPAAEQGHMLFLQPDLQLQPRKLGQREGTTGGPPNNHNRPNRPNRAPITTPPPHRSLQLVLQAQNFSQKFLAPRHAGKRVWVARVRGARAVPRAGVGGRTAGRLLAPHRLEPLDRRLHLAAPPSTPDSAAALKPSVCACAPASRSPSCPAGPTGLRVRRRRRGPLCHAHASYPISHQLRSTLRNQVL
ncbi:hypothetical protein TSOC_006561 [Tetrabaena socialis]|uniref:Uncharacterized protein n=1 Tax=Tetrabaena socialis TaxID=47790 RepID=A0A2J8A3E8_9CHLO|nr:hypothetical protein TSOC_006561 [Tetrabaena socialis]|eukprot:PNH07049.1 hypothetical protein TSOC_006561 [Tetrabaena socialis]